MDEKGPLLPSPSLPHDDAVKATEEAVMRQKRKSRFQIAAIVILFSIFWLARTWSCDHEHIESSTTVPLEVHIMQVDLYTSSSSCTNYNQVQMP